MDAFEWNKVFGAVLASVLGILLIREAVHIAFHADLPEELAYAVELPEDGGGAPVEEAPVVEEIFDPVVIFASVDVAKGEATMNRACKSCHQWQDGGAHGVGPNLYGVMGADIARHGDYSYSNALAGIDGPWTLEAMYGFLKKPKEWAPGTKMGYSGLRKSEDRANLIAYLNQQSGSPIPVP
ncbi:MAG: c-type cytochrome [Pseudomonadota bacterium]